MSYIRERRAEDRKQKTGDERCWMCGCVKRIAYVVYRMLLEEDEESGLRSFDYAQDARGSKLAFWVEKV